MSARFCLDLYSGFTLVGLIMLPYFKPPKERPLISTKKTDATKGLPPAAVRSANKKVEEVLEEIFSLTPSLGKSLHGPYGAYSRDLKSELKMEWQQLIERFQLN